MTRGVTARRARSLLLFALVSFTVSLPATDTAAGIPARLDCSLAADGTGRWGIYLPPPGVAERTYWTTFYYKFVPASGYYGHDWRPSPAWYAGDSQNGIWWTESTGIQPLAPNSWAFWTKHNSGMVYVWEYQWYQATNTFVWNDLGYCQTYQFYVFNPVPLPG